MSLKKIGEMIQQLTYSDMMVLADRLFENACGEIGWKDKHDASDSLADMADEFVWMDEAGS